MESSGSDCDSNVDNDVSASSIPDSGPYQSGMRLCCQNALIIFLSILCCFMTKFIFTIRSPENSLILLIKFFLTIAIIIQCAIWFENINNDEWEGMENN